jgi:hypothetical protein
LEPEISSAYVPCLCVFVRIEQDSIFTFVSTTHKGDSVSQQEKLLLEAFRAMSSDWQTMLLRLARSYSASSRKQLKAIMNVPWVASQPPEPLS